jgi:hypothetical protein
MTVLSALNDLALAIARPLEGDKAGLDDALLVMCLIALEIDADDGTALVHHLALKVVEGREEDGPSRLVANERPDAARDAIFSGQRIRRRLRLDS